MFHKALATVDDDSCDGSKQSKLKTSWKGFTILDALKDTYDLWEEVKIPTLIGIWKKLIPTLLDDFEGFKTSGKKVTADFVEIAKELEVETNDLTELLQSYHKTWTNEELLLTDEQSDLLRWNLHLVKMLWRWWKWPKRI